MSDIFIEWDRDRVVVAEGVVEGRSVRLRRSSMIPRAADSADTLDVVSRLRELFPAGSSRSRQSVTVVFPRQLVTVHRIEIPQVPDSEIADIVRLQATMRLTVPVDSVCLDFTPLPVVAGSETRDVLMVTVPNEQVDLARRTVSDAGLQLSEVRVSAFCIAQAAEAAGLLSPAADASRVDIVALMRGDFIELTFTRGSAVVFSHSGSSWSSPDAIERALRAELNRARMSAAESLGTHQIGRLILIGTDETTRAVSDAISNRLDGAQVERVNPERRLVTGSFPEGTPATDLVTVAGAMFSGGQTSVAAVDLINPRRAPEKKDYRRARTLGATLAGVLVLAGIQFWRQSRLSALEADEAALLEANGEISIELKAAEAELQQAAAIGDWVRRDFDWLEHILQLKALLPGNDRMYLDTASFNIVPKGGTCTIAVTGFARSEADANAIPRRLVEAGYSVEQFDAKERSSAVSDYSWAVSLRVVPPASTTGEAPKS